MLWSMVAQPEVLVVVPQAEVRLVRLQQCRSQIVK